MFSLAAGYATFFLLNSIEHEIETVINNKIACIKGIFVLLSLKLYICPDH